VAKPSPVTKLAPARPPSSGGGWGSSSSTDGQSEEEMRAFLQRRVASFGLMLAALFGMFFVWRLISALLVNDDPSLAFLPWQALSVGAFAGMWATCRRGRRSVRFIRTVEVLGLTAAASAAIAMSLRISYAARPDAILLLCLTYTLIVRAIFIPSTPRHTLILGLMFAAPFLVSVYFIHVLRHDPAAYTAAADPRMRLPAQEIARRWTVVSGLWWIASMGIAVATSRVIYGLRKQVRDARRLGQYTLIEKLGEGGMGTVYRARHAMLRRPTAIKLLPPDKFGDESVARFEREVQLTARLSHPSTIRVFDYGRTPDGIFYYAMECLEGATLSDVVAEGGPLPAGRVIHLLEQAAGALTEAHGIGLIHRDIKPANIFLTEQGGIPDVVKVLDFGLVKQVAERSAGAGAVTTTAIASQVALTQEGGLAGTPLYMAPEAFTTPDKVDPRTDLYALGAVGYFLITGQEVFTGRTVLEVCSQHLQATPVPPTQRLGKPVPPDLERLILACLEKDPARRPASARALQAALRACRDARAWSEDDARRWLDAHGPALRARQPRAPVGSDATVAVDIGLRAPETPPRRKAV
jgi:serine/threonine protein kinase